MAPNLSKLMPEPNKADGRKSSRERKQIEILQAPTLVKKEFTILEGKGTKLKDIPNVDFQLTKVKSDDEILKLIHKILFKTPGKMTTAKKNIREFSGFVDGDRAKTEDLVSRAFRATLNQLMDIFDLPRGSGDDAKKEAQVKRIIDFLDCPTESGKKNMKESVAVKREKAATKKQKVASKKQVTAAQKLQLEKEKLKKKREKLKALEAKLKAKEAKLSGGSGTPKKRKATESPANLKAAKKPKMPKMPKMPKEEEGTEEEESKDVSPDEAEQETPVGDEEESEDGFPSNYALEAAVKALLQNVDLSTVSMRKVRMDLEEKFKCSLSKKRDIIKDFITNVIACHDSTDTRAL